MPLAVPHSILMVSGALDHDREPAGPSRDPAGGFATALDRLRLDGAIFFRSEFTERWAYQSPTPAMIAAILHPGAERLIFFHIVAAGGCWIQRGADRLWASEGDVIVLPYGEQHSMGGTEPTEVVSILDLFDPPPWERLPVLRYGMGGSRTDIVCGYLHSDHPLFNPAMRALPSVFVVRPEGVAASWIRSSVEYALAASSPTPNADASGTRLPELVLTETLRLHLATAPAIDSGWIAALSDPILAPAMAKLHAAPHLPWTVEQLATTVAVSRSVLDERFRRVLGRPPIRYLTDWRMHQAEELLTTTNHSVATVGRRVGYESEEAFSRAFKRARGLAPGAWRSEQVSRAMT